MTVRCASNGRSASSTSGLLAPAAQSSASCATCSCLPWPAVLPRRPHRPYYSHHWPGLAATAASHHSRTSEPSNFSPRGLPLPRLPQLLVIPFLGLVVVHRPGALSAAWSTWSRNGFHRTWTVRGEADSWVHGRSKEVPPYYVENNDSSTWQLGPAGWATVFREKTLLSLTSQTHQLYLRTQGSASLLRTKK